MQVKMQLRSLKISDTLKKPSKKWNNSWLELLKTMKWMMLLVSNKSLKTIAIPW